MQQPEQAFSMQTRHLLHVAEHATLFAALGLGVQGLHSLEVFAVFRHGHLVFCRHALTLPQ